jgi:hypothetical protein
LDGLNRLSGRCIHFHWNSYFSGSLDHWTTFSGLLALHIFPLDFLNAGRVWFTRTKRPNRDTSPSHLVCQQKFRLMEEKSLLIESQLQWIGQQIVSSVP